MNFKTFLLLLIILLCGIFLYIKTQSLGDENSWFNQTTRYSLGKTPFFRSLFSLHKDGDARSWYLNSDFIIIEVVQAEGVKLDDKTVFSFADKVEKLTGKKTEVHNTDTVQRGTLKPADIESITQGTRRHFDPKAANLYILYAEDFESEGNELGKTLKEFGMVVSHNRLQELTKYHATALHEYQESTFLHEFGHQIGLAHNDRPECIMNEKAEVPEQALYFSGAQTPTNFCTLELEQLETIKKNLQ